ncbi:MAG: hypothetical protein Q8L78_07885 [Coxiellaceae bacterium]|nr:hypothetical protein [Coxiellaceae bacterium]
MIFFRKKYCRETILFVFLSIFLALLSYYLLLNSTLKNYYALKNEKLLILNTLEKDDVLQTKDIAIQKQLQIIHDKNNPLYVDVQSLKTTDQLSSELSILIEKAGFSIQSIQPTTTNQDLHFQVMTIGNYFSLFRLMALLKKNAWPIQLAALQIEKKDTYHLDFLAAKIA